MDKAAVGVVPDPHTVEGELNGVAEDAVGDAVDAQIDRAATGVIAAMTAPIDAGISVSGDDGKCFAREVSGERDEEGRQPPVNGVVLPGSNTAKELAELGERVGPELAAGVEEPQLEPLAGVEILQRDRGSAGRIHLLHLGDPVGRGGADAAGRAYRACCQQGEHGPSAVEKSSKHDQVHSEARRVPIYAGVDPWAEYGRDEPP